MKRKISSIISVIILFSVAVSGCSFTIYEKSISSVSMDRLESVIGEDMDFPLFSHVAGEDFIVVSIVSDADLIAQDERQNHVSASAYFCDEGSEKSQVGASGVYWSGQSVSGLHSLRHHSESNVKEDLPKVYKIVIFSKWDAEFAAAKGANNDFYPEFDFYSSPRDVCLRIQYADMVRVVESNELTITRDKISKLLL